MGQSTNGLLYYGFTFCDPDEDGDPPWATEGGPPAPGVEYSDETRQQFHAYWDAKREFIKSTGITIVNHCSCDYPMYAIAAAESEHTAYRGSPERLGDILEAPSSWSAKLFDVCEKLGLEWQDPQWELASLWC